MGTESLNELEYDSGTAEHLFGIRAVSLFGIKNCESGRKTVARLPFRSLARRRRQVVVSNNYVHSEFICIGNFFGICNATINIDEKFYASIVQLLDRFHIESKAFAVAVRNIVFKIQIT